MVFTRRLRRFRAFLLAFTDDSQGGFLFIKILIVRASNKSLGCLLYAHCTSVSRGQMHQKSVYEILRGTFLVYIFDAIRDKIK